MSEKMQAGLKAHMNKGGRHRDPFCWDNVTVEGGSSRWRCNHCGVVYSGSASRIRNHLAGQGGGIKPCRYVDPQIRELAREERAELAAAAAVQVAEPDLLEHNQPDEQIRRVLPDDERRGPAQAAEPAAAAVQVSNSMLNNNVANVDERRGPNYVNLAAANNGEAWGIANNTFSSMLTTPVICNYNMPGEMFGIGRIANPDIHPAQHHSHHGQLDHINMNVPGENLGIANNTNTSMVAPSPVTDYMNSLADLLEDNQPLPTANNVEAPVQVSSSSAFLPEMHDQGREKLSDILLKFATSTTKGVESLRELFHTLAECKNDPAVTDILDSPAGLEKLLSLTIKHKSAQYITMVSESRKTIGLTSIMLYNLLIEKQKDSPCQNQLVVGWYSPKGIYFSQGDGLPNDDVIHYINHPYVKTASECYYQSLDDNHGIPGHQSTWCVQDRIRRFCKDIIGNEAWVATLITRSEILYKCMMIRTQTPERRSIQEKLIRIGDGTNSSPIAQFRRLIEIVRLELDFKQWKKSISKQERESISNSDTGIILQIIKADDFWSDGVKLKKSVSPLMEIYTFVDTLDPTAGYMHAKIDNARSVLEKCYRKAELKYSKIWKCFQDHFRDLTSQENEHVPSYLSPAYISTKTEGNLNLSAAGKDALRNIVAIDEQDLQALDAELEAYSSKSTNPLAKIPPSEFKNDPIQLWEKYGRNDFPLLKKCAVKLLNQPMSCLCNQVKKCVSQIQGTDDKIDNYIERLNLKMKEEFENKEAASRKRKRDS